MSDAEAVENAEEFVGLAAGRSFGYRAAVEAFHHTTVSKQSNGHVVPAWNRVYLRRASSSQSTISLSGCCWKCGSSMLGAYEQSA